MLKPLRPPGAPPRTPANVLNEVLDRTKRIETRMVKLMEHVGLDREGKPIQKKPDGTNPQ